MIKYLKRHRFFLIFLSVILLISIGIGIIIYLKSSNESKIYITDQLSNLKESLLNTKINNIFRHLLIIIVIILLSFTILGYFSGVAYLFYEGISIGFTISSLVANYALKGLLFGILYNLLFKLFYIIVYIFILLKLFDLVKLIINQLLFKKTYTIKNNIKRISLSIVIFILIIFINDVIIYFFTNFLLKLIINVL